MMWKTIFFNCFYIDDILWSQHGEEKIIYALQLWGII